MYRNAYEKFVNESVTDVITPFNDHFAAKAWGRTGLYKRFYYWDQPFPIVSVPESYSGSLYRGSCALSGRAAMV